MEVCQGLSTAFVVFDQVLPSRVAHAKDRSTTHRSSGQQHETALGLRQFDDLEGNAAFSGSSRWFLPAV